MVADAWLSILDTRRDTHDKRTNVFSGHSGNCGYVRLWHDIRVDHECMSARECKRAEDERMDRKQQHSSLNLNEILLSN